MITLGSLLLSKEASVVEFRNKVMALARELEFSPLKVTRIGTAASDLVREALSERVSIRVRVVISETRNVSSLGFMFDDCARRDLLDLARRLFRGAAILSAPGSDTSTLWVAEPLPNPRFIPGEAFVAEQTERITGLSKSDALLRVILPETIAEELSVHERVETRRHNHVAVLFTDIVGFTKFCDAREPDEVVVHLQEITEAFEGCSNRHQLEKIKTIGDAYMAASGLLTPLDNPVMNAVECGLDMVESLKNLSSGWNVRVGIHVGSVIAGVVGAERFSYDLWGDAVNTASRVESNGEPGFVNISEQALRYVMGDCIIASHKIVEAKGKGEFKIFQVSGKRELEWNPQKKGATGGKMPAPAQ